MIARHISSARHQLLKPRFLWAFPGALERRGEAALPTKPFSTDTSASSNYTNELNPNWKTLLSSIKRCHVSSLIGDIQIDAAFKLLGSKVVEYKSDDIAQAVLHISDEGGLMLTICGTRFGSGSIPDEATDFWEDAEPIFNHKHLADGDIVACGALDRWNAIWAWAKPHVGDAPLVVEGHSLGGQAAHVAMRLLGPQVTQAFAWEPPKAMNDSAWQKVDISRCVTVVHGRDPLAAWPPAFTETQLRHPPGPMLWIRDDNSWEWTTRSGLPGGDPLRVADHFSNNVSAAVEAIFQKLQK